MRVLLVTTWGSSCGIAEHSAMLKEAVERADPAITLEPHVESLDPVLCHQLLAELHEDFDLIHLNYHAALHSRWTPDQICLARRKFGKKILVTYHDTGVPNSEQCQKVIDAADAAVVHEPFDDLPPKKTYYWRMGVLDVHTPVSPWQLVSRGQRPIVGTIGFPFGWKNHTELVRRAAAAGWGCLLIVPGADGVQIDEWLSINDQILVRADFVPRHEAVMWLGGCAATAFTYVTHNAGQSGALLMGVAASKPVFALSTCRQFRALYEDPLGFRAIRWCETFDGLQRGLEVLAASPAIQKRDTIRIRQLARKDSWSKLGRKYARLYRELAGVQRAWDGYDVAQ